MWRYVCLKDTLGMIMYEDYMVYIYNLKDFSIRTVPSDYLFDRLEDVYYNDVHCDEYCSDVQLMVSDDEILYLVLNMNVRDPEDEDEVVQSYSVCYKLDSKEKWHFICRTPQFDIDDENNNIYASD